MLLFIGVMGMAAGCWLELSGGCFWEVYNVVYLLLKSIGDIWLVPRGWLLFGGVVKRGFVKRGFTVLLIKLV